MMHNLKIAIKNSKLGVGCIKIMHNKEKILIENKEKSENPQILQKFK